MTGPPLPVSGWVERVALPDLGVPLLLAKVDTGARTCALHVVDARVALRPDGRGGTREFLTFDVPFDVDGAERSSEVTAPLLGRIAVRDSGGHTEVRPLISTRICLGSQVFEARVTLTRRSEMVYPMLVGRTALAGRFLVDPSARLLLGEPMVPAPARAP